MASPDGGAPATAAAPNDHPDIVAFPPLIASSAAVLSGLVQWLVPVPWPLSGVSRWWGLVPFAIAMAVVSAARRTMTAAGTNVRPDRPSTAIVDGGPYRYTRNPMYLSLMLLQVALALGTRWTWALWMLAPLFALYHFGVVLREERYLDAKFGEVYRAYRARVRRWL